MGLLLLLSITAGCGANQPKTGEENNHSYDNLSYDALVEINEQNMRRHAAIQDAIFELAAITGPIRDSRDGGKISSEQELRERVKMAKQRIADLEAMSLDETDKQMIEQLKLIIESKEIEISRLGNDLEAAYRRLEAKKRELENVNLQLANTNNQLSSTNRQLRNKQSELARILYITAQDYMRMGDISFYKLNKSGSRSLQSTCFRNAAIRFQDAQSSGYGNCATEINNAYARMNAVN